MKESLLFVSIVAGGNFCAGYDLAEVAGYESTDALPDVEQLENGHGPMVMNYLVVFFKLSHDLQLHEYFELI